MLNVYAMPEAFYFLDLPGYGYARASHTERASFRGLVRHTIERPRLRGVVWLLDIRRDPSPEDRGMQDLLVAAGTPVLAAVTKSDKLPREQQRARVRELQADLGLDDDQMIATSARGGEGIDELREAIVSLIGAAHGG